MPTADSGGGVTDAATITRHIVSSGRRLHKSNDVPPKDGARFHFSYPGSVQGFRGENCEVENVEVAGTGKRALAVRPNAESNSSIRAVTGTFIDSKETAKYFGGRGYGLMTSPSLNPGQVVRCQVASSALSETPASVSICVGVFDENDEVVYHRGATCSVASMKEMQLEWKIPDYEGFPVSCVGIEVETSAPGDIVYLDRLDWSGAPSVQLRKCAGDMWWRAWVNAVDAYGPRYPESFRLVHNRGTGLLLYGCRDWTDYCVSADVTPHLVNRVGVACRVQGMKRYYALVLTKDKHLRLVKELNETTTLAEVAFAVEFGRTYQLSLRVDGTSISGSIDGQELLEANDQDLPEGGIALLIDEGRTATHQVSVSPI